MDNLDFTAENIALEEGHSSNLQSVNEERPRVTLYATWSAVFVALTGLWQYGFSIGAINAAYVPVTDAVRQQYEQRWKANVTSEFVEAIWVTSSAAFPVGGIVGSLLIGPVVRRFGRLHCMFLGHVIIILTSLIIGLSKISNSPEVLIFGRLATGVTSGAGIGICVIYVIEVSPQHVRGVFGSLVAVGISVGLTLSNAFGLPHVLGNEKYWPLLLALTGVPSVLFILLIKTLPKSPRKLYIEDKNEEDARKLLMRLNGMRNVDSIIAEMKQEEESSLAVRQTTVREVFCSKSLRPSLVAALVIAAAQQVTGLNGVAFNMNNIYLKAGIHEDYVHYVSICVSGLVLVIYAFTIPLTEKYGRKILLTFGYAIEGISLLILTISIECYYISHVMSYVSIAASIVFWIGFAIGPGPVTLVIVAEFFDQSSRSAAMAISTVLLWLGFTVTVVTTPYMLDSIRGYTFLLFGIIALLTAGFIMFKVPETKNRPFCEIQQSFLR